MREVYRQELKDIKADVVDLGRIVIEMTRDATTALVEGDVELAERVVATDDAVDSRCLALEERTVETIATQFPVARDLRLLYSLAHIALHMERMGDLGVNIAKAALRTAEKQGPSTLYDLVRESMAGKAGRMPDNVQEKLQRTLQRIVNDGCNGLICILL